MPERSKLPAKNLPVRSEAKTEEFATKVFEKSGYPKTVKQNIKTVLNLFVNFFF